MDIFRLHKGRYLLFLDILGFKHIVQSRPASDVYSIIDATVSEFAKREARIHDFRTLYFSDTIVFYQDCVGWGGWAFLDIYAIAGLAWSALAARRIPCRGAIAFGDFTVADDTGNRHTLFFGNALIEAYETSERRERDVFDWIGVTICPDAWKAVDCMEEGLIDAFASEGQWLRDGEFLRLNPLIKLKSVFEQFQLGEITGNLLDWDAPDFANEVKALAFIMEQADSNSLSTEIRIKYIQTKQVLTQLIASDCLSWALQAAQASR